MNNDDNDDYNDGDEDDAFGDEDGFDVDYYDQTDITHISNINDNDQIR